MRYYALEPLVEQLFGEDINVCLSSADRDLASYVHLQWENTSSRGKLTKVTCKMVELVKEKLHLMSDSELNKLLNIDSKLISTQIVDSSASNAATKPQAALVAKSKSSTVKAKAKATTTKSKAAKATTSSATKASADEATNATNATDATDVKPKKKATRAKKDSTATAKATAGEDASAQARA